MKNLNETGHAKNLANFDELVSFVSAYGTSYNPSKASISLAELQKLSTDARTSLFTLNEALSELGNASADREAAFKPLNKMATRVMNALRAIDTTQELDDKARFLVRKIQGIRVTPKKTDEEKKILADEGKEVREISSSQQGFDNRLENFDKLIKLVTENPLYLPNEDDLKKEGLSALYTKLSRLNNRVVNALVSLSNARIARDELFSLPETGMVDITLAVKSYVKSLYGGTSPEYRQLSALAFKSVIK